ncbi:hypothetical protein HZA73_03820 [candidate division TA06 bacterium]|nr:hypothetical protein [candidate division TA06 bacterium]
MRRIALLAVLSIILMVSTGLAAVVVFKGYAFTNGSVPLVGYTITISGQPSCGSGVTSSNGYFEVQGYYPDAGYYTLVATKRYQGSLVSVSTYYHNGSYTTDCGNVNFEPPTE